jgi:zinc transport system substrate-binding protein
MVYMKKVLIIILFVLHVTNVQAASEVNIFVSILPQQYFVEKVGSEYVDVHVMVGPGQNPATYEPTPQQMVALANADIYFNIGVPFERAWLDKIRSSNEKLIIIECCKTISNLTEHSHNDAYHDPHVWTSPKKVILIVKLIEKSLKKINEKNGSNYEKHASEFIDELNELDNIIKSKVAVLKNKKLIVSHPSWSYFADEYGFSQISIEQEGKEIQARSMVRLIELAKEENIRAVFVQSQFNSKAAKIIANEIDAVVLELDPLAFNYIENMNDVVDKIVQGLSYE